MDIRKRRKKIEAEFISADAANVTIKMGTKTFLKKQSKTQTLNTQDFQLAGTES